MFAMFLAAVDQTILASALPAIVASLGGFADLSWVVVAYLLAATVAAPLYGSIGDRFGRRPTLLAALTVFTLASLGCALAPTLLALIVARAVQGHGRRRLDDLVAGADQRKRAAAATRAVPGLLRRRVCRLEHAGAAARRAVDRASELAGGFLHQSAAGRGRRGCSRCAFRRSRRRRRAPLPPRRPRNRPLRHRDLGAAVCAVLGRQSLRLARLAAVSGHRAGARAACQRSWSGKCARPTR